MREIKFFSNDGHTITYWENKHNPYGNWDWKDQGGRLVKLGIARGIEGLMFKLPSLKKWKRKDGKI